MQIEYFVNYQYFTMFTIYRGKHSFSLEKYYKIPVSALYKPHEKFSKSSDLERLLICTHIPPPLADFAKKIYLLYLF